MTSVEQVLAAIARYGLLLTQDKALPSVVGIITGESLRTSWWSHPKAQRIFGALSALSEHPDVLFTKLLYRKETLVHRSLWPAFLAVARAREPWQIRGLSDGAKALLKRLDRGEAAVRITGAPVKELEVRLLVRAHEIHTESGRHEMVVESWDACFARAGCIATDALPEARRALEHATTTLGALLSALPWRRRGAAT